MDYFSFPNQSALELFGKVGVPNWFINTVDSQEDFSLEASSLNGVYILLIPQMKQVGLDLEEQESFLHSGRKVELDR
jgi:hypothetical protein